MDVSDPSRRGRAVRGVFAAAGVLLVAGLVALASAGETGAGNVRRPSDRLLDLLFSFGLVLLGTVLLAGAALYLYGWHLRIRGGVSRRPPSMLRGLVVLVLFAVLVSALVYFRRRGLGSTGDEEPGAPGGFPGPSDSTSSGRDYEPEFTTVPVLVLLGAVLAALVAFLLVQRAQRRASSAGTPAEPPPSLDEVLADTLDDLRCEPDPRRAVIASYARLERALAAAGHPRRQSDAPGEYLARVLHEAEVSPDAVARLTVLFARAKFSQHEVAEEMRGDAIEALEQVREDLRAAERAREVPVLA